MGDGQVEKTKSCYLLKRRILLSSPLNIHLLKYYIHGRKVIIVSSFFLRKYLLFCRLIKKTHTYIDDLSNDHLI